MGFLDIIGGIVSPITNLIDELHTSDEEKMQLKQQFFLVQAQLMQNVLAYETENAKMKADIIKAEANAQGGWSGWLTRSWRPITMLTFVGLIVARWLGFAAPGLDPSLEVELFSIIKLGLGGYVIGRSAETVVKTGAAAFKIMNESKTE